MGCHSPDASCANAGTRSSALESRKTSLSVYCGRRFDVLRAMFGMDKENPKPKTPLPPPELYWMFISGTVPRQGVVTMRMVKPAVPENLFGWNSML